MALQRKEQIIRVHSFFLLKKIGFLARLNILICLPVLAESILMNILSLKPHVTLITPCRNVVSIEYTDSAVFVVLGVSWCTGAV